VSSPGSVARVLVAFCALALVATSCAGGSSDSAHEAAARPTGFGLRVPDGVDLLATRHVLVRPGGTRRVAVDFEQAPSGSLLVLGPRARAVTARFRGTRLAYAPLLGIPALTATIEPAVAGTLVVHNPTRRRVELQVLVAARTPRSLSVETPDDPTPPATPVEIRITLSGASQKDVPYVEVHDDTHRLVVFRTQPRRVAPGRWVATFTPVRAGDYTAVASVGPSRPRSARSYFWVTNEAP
jgi:hypothetical protein